MADALYLPKPEVVKAVSFGYRNALANYLWFKTISYFGKHHRVDQNYRWLFDMCKLVNDLNPGEKVVVEFCSTMLSWEVNAPEKSIELLTSAMQQHPLEWRFPYLRGFNYMFFLNDDQRAAADFQRASRLPGADPFVARLASKKLAITNTPESALEFIQDLLRNTKDESARRALEERLLDAKHEVNLARLERLVAQFKDREGRTPQNLEELQTRFQIKEIPPDPYGGAYYLELETGAVLSTSARRRLSSRAKRPEKAPYEQ